MAKVSMVQRDLKRKKIAEKYAQKREKYKSIIGNPNFSEEEQIEAQLALQKLPRNASPCRQRNRCRLSGRPHGYYRKFGLARNKLRETAMRGDIPGLVKSSW
ncbi:MAG: 30S ribosomal protein S14 [Gammaproteobacteria bacterium]|nr:MAG: 30S ribosomal protein S14 [Gammaproteobacteria bacterium]